MLDFLIAYANICDLYNAEFPIQAVQLTGVDTNKHCLNFAQTVVQTYADTLAERIDLLAESISDSHILMQAENWARQAEWRHEDMNHNPLKTPTDPALLIASNVFNELTFQGKQNINQTISHLPPESMMIIVEPGDRNSTQKLNKWRRKVLQQINGLEIIAPCGGEYGSQQPKQCDWCWNSRRERKRSSGLKNLQGFGIAFPVLSISG